MIHRPRWPRSPPGAAGQGNPLQMSCRAVRVLFAVAIVGLSLPALAQTAAQPTPQTPRPVSSAGVPAYTIGPSDVLRIIVWKEPDLTQDVTVRADGMITFPLLGDMEAA